MRFGNIISLVFRVFGQAKLLRAWPCGSGSLSTLGKPERDRALDDRVAFRLCPSKDGASDVSRIDQT